MAAFSEKLQVLSYDTFPSNPAPSSRQHPNTHSHSNSPLLITQTHDHLPSTDALRILPLRTKLLFIAMVAIPAYLLASTAFSSLKFFNPLQSATRSPQPEALPATSLSTGRPLENDDFRSILGPVVTTNFPDPAIIHLNGTSYAFATNNKGIGKYGMIHIQVASSKDNQTWEVMEGYDALPAVGKWETGFGVWAPDVVQVGNGSFVMYYASSTASSPDHHCVGVATSDSILGPYIPEDEPWACPDVNSLGGAIDPDGFLDPSTGHRYVTYKVDGNSIGHGGLCKNGVAPIVPTPIMLQEVDLDGHTKIGRPREILDRDQLDGPLVEAPSLHRSAEGIYFLFYASNCFTTPLYATNYATSKNIWGPYKKQGRPLLITGDGPSLVGPGGLDIAEDGDLVLFHGHLNAQNMLGDLSEIGKKKKPTRRRNGDPTTLVRGMYAARAQFNGTMVSFAGPIPGPP